MVRALAAKARDSGSIPGNPKTFLSLNILCMADEGKNNNDLYRCSYMYMYIARTCHVPTDQTHERGPLCVIHNNI